MFDSLETTGFPKPSAPTTVQYFKSYTCLLSSFMSAFRIIMVSLSAVLGVYFQPGPAKTRRAPSRLCRDARSMVIYDYGMQDYEYPSISETQEVND